MAKLSSTPSEESSRAAGRLTPPKSSALALTAQPGRALTTAQVSFNRLVAKVEKLRAKLDAETRALDAALEKYVREIHPCLQRLTEMRGELVRAMSPFLFDRRITVARDRRSLREWLGHHLNRILVSEGALPDDLRIVYREIYREDVEAAEKREFQVRRDSLQEMFGQMGVDIDLSDLGPELEEAEFDAQVRARLAEAGYADGNGPQSRSSSAPRSKSRRAKAAVEQVSLELRKKTLSSIYKQLAKELHPDLERDPAERARKVTLMQELTVAHREGDLHTLLRMEIEWLHRAESEVARLSDETIAVFNAVLRQQVQDLEGEILRLPHDPRYQALERSDGGPRWTGAKPELGELARSLVEIETSLVRLRGPRAVNEVKVLLANWRAGLAF